MYMIRYTALCVRYFHAVLKLIITFRPWRNAIRRHLVRQSHQRIGLRRLESTGPTAEEEQTKVYT